MSIASPFDTETDAGFDAQSLRSLARRPVEAAAFWAAVALPVAYPTLMYGGLDGRELLLLLAALAVHASALLLGRGHSR